MRLFKYPLLCLCAGVISSALANQATFENKSSAPITVLYKVAHQNPGQATVYSDSKTVQVGPNETAMIPFSFDGYKKGGIVPLAINDTKLPTSVTLGEIPANCMTSDPINSGRLTLTFKDGHPKSLSCSVQE